MKITISKIKDYGVMSASGYKSYPGYYEANVYYQDGIGGTLHFYAKGETRAQAKKALKEKLVGIKNLLESVL